MGLFPANVLLPPQKVALISHLGLEMIDDSLLCDCAKGGAAASGPVRELSDVRTQLLVAVPPKVCMILKYGKDCYPRDVFCSSASRSSLITILLLHPVFLRHKTHLFTLNWKIWNPTSILLSRGRRRTTRRRHSNPLTGVNGVE